MQVLPQMTESKVTTMQVPNKGHWGSRGGTLYIGVYEQVPTNAVTVQRVSGGKKGLAVVWPL